MKLEEYAKQRRCMYCELPIPENARMRFSHDSLLDCIKLLKERVSALEESQRAFLEKIGVTYFAQAEVAFRDIKERNAYLETNLKYEIEELEVAEALRGQGEHMSDEVGGAS